MTPQVREERFRALYESVRPRVVAYALRRTATPDDAADIVAETFSIAWRRLDDIPSGEAELLWCYATARRVIANHRRRLQRRDELVDRIGVELGLALTGRVDSNNDDALTARGALRRLSDEDRELLMLVGWEGLSSVQLACVLRCSPTAARIRLHRARSRLQAAMTKLEAQTKQERQSRHIQMRSPWPAEIPGKA